MKENTNLLSNVLNFNFTLVAPDESLTLSLTIHLLQSGNEAYNFMSKTLTVFPISTA